VIAEDRRAFIRDAESAKDMNEFMQNLQRYRTE
jgi:hypothetical protein